jgi:uncharacterized protein (DUF2236 family)
MGLYLRITSNLVDRRSYWAPDPDEYLWYHQNVYLYKLYNATMST